MAAVVPLAVLNARLEMGGSGRYPVVNSSGYVRVIWKERDKKPHSCDKVCPTHWPLSRKASGSWQAMDKVNDLRFWYRDHNLAVDPHSGQHPDRFS